MMTVHEFGKENGDVVVLIHPSAVMWDYFEHVIPLLRDRFHLILPALPGYDETAPDEDYTSVEQIATELAGWLDANGCRQVACLYGCSMGGSVVLRMLADEKVDIQNAVVDGGITPYRLPWIVTRLIAVRDFLLVCIGRWGAANSCGLLGAIPPWPTSSSMTSSASGNILSMYLRSHLRSFLSASAHQYCTRASDSCGSAGIR